MKLSLDGHNRHRNIQAFDQHSITIGETRYAYSLQIDSQGQIQPWPIEHIDQLQLMDLQHLLDTEPDVILLGTGQHQQFPAMPLLARIMQLPVGVEIMDTAAACRSYNVLVAESRDVAAAFILG